MELGHEIDLLEKQLFILLEKYPLTLDEEERVDTLTGLIKDLYQELQEKEGTLND